jgi:hypothetical protein
VGPARISDVLWRGAGYLVRSVFWTGKWFRISRERLPAPPANAADSGFSVLRSAVALGLIVLAYSLYPRHQVRSLAAVVAGFASGFSVDAWVSTAALVAVAYLLLGWTLRVSWRPLLRPVLHVLHPMVLALAAFAVVYPAGMSFFHQLRALNPSHPVPRAAEHLAWTLVLWTVASWFMAWPFFGFAYSAYRVSRYHLFGQGLHPALAPLVELALAARALSLALAGKAQILNLPPVPGRLVAAAPALLATAYFSHRAIGAQRALLHQQGSGLHRQLGRLGRDVGNRRRPVRTRLRSLWDFRRTQTGRLGLGLLAVALGALVSAVLPA